MLHRWSAEEWRGNGVKQEWGKIEISNIIFFLNLEEKDHQEIVNMGAVIWTLVLKVLDVIRMG